MSLVLSFKCFLLPHFEVSYIIALSAFVIFCMFLGIIFKMISQIDWKCEFYRSLLAIGKGCKQLKNLTLSDCYFLSDKSLGAIATGCSKLTHLEVNGCHNIGTFGLGSIGKKCP